MTRTSFYWYSISSCHSWASRQPGRRWLLRRLTTRTLMMRWWTLTDRFTSLLAGLAHWDASTLLALSVKSSMCFSGFMPSVLWCCWLGGRKGIRPVKSRVVRYWRGYLSGVRCKWFAYGPAGAIATPSSPASVKSRMVYLSGAGLPKLSWKKGR